MVTLRQALLLGAMAGSAVLGWGGHNVLVYQPHLKKDQQVVTRALIAQGRIEGATQQIAQDVRDTLDTRQETTRGTTQTIIKAIPVYLPPALEGLPGEGHMGREAGDGGSLPVPPGASLPIGFGRLHDYAALGIDPPVPAPSGEPLGAASGVTLPGLAETIADNYGLCHQDANEVKAWREWYAKEAAAWPTK